MKLSHFLRYYQNIKGISLPPEKAEKEAAKHGIIIDRPGEVGNKGESSGKSNWFVKSAA